MAKKPNNSELDLGDTDAAESAAVPEAATPVDASARIKARVLLDCSHGRVDELVELDPAALAVAKAAGEVDDHPAAVAYVEGLRRNS